MLWGNPKMATWKSNVDRNMVNKSFLTPAHINTWSWLGGDSLAIAFFAWHCKAPGLTLSLGVWGQGKLELLLLLPSNFTVWETSEEDHLSIVVTYAAATDNRNAFFFFLVLCFEIGSLCVSHSGTELSTLQLQLPMGWNCWCVHHSQLKGKCCKNTSGVLK